MNRSIAYLGKSSGTSDGYVGMELDALRVYDYALSPSVVQRLYISTNFQVPTEVPAQTVDNPYSSAPIYRLSVDSPPPPASQLLGTSFIYIDHVDGKLGAAALDGV